MLRALILLLTLVFATTSQAGAPFTRSFSGDWRGVGIQTGGSDWQMQLTIGATLAMVRYPGLRCGGTWRYSQDTPESLNGVETIEYGLENCVQTGNILLRPYGEGQLIYLWCGDEAGVSAVAVLERDGFLPGDYRAQHAATQAALDTLGMALENISCGDNSWFGV